MEKRTIAQAAIAVLTAAKKPMTAAEITQAILEQGLYGFNAKDPKAMVRGAIERRCEGVNRKNSTSSSYFKKLPDGKYGLVEITLH
jgi:HB1, ASXL, restriction endonuclease HTH domain